MNVLREAEGSDWLATRFEVVFVGVEDGGCNWPVVWLQAYGEGGQGFGTARAVDTLDVFRRSGEEGGVGDLGLVGWVVAPWTLVISCATSAFAAEWFAHCKRMFVSRSRFQGRRINRCVSNIVIGSPI
jgi:hypothetical protein